MGRVCAMLLLVCISLLTGCASTKQYSAESLPVQFQAPPLANAQTLDLTKLATSTTATDLIGEGDVIEVTISAGLSADETVTFPVRVTEKGLAQLPIIGQVRLAGADLEEAEAIIAGVCVNKGLYRSPHVTVTMKRAKVHRITVLGAVELPATYELRASQSDVLQAIVAAGGLSEDAGTFVQIRQPGQSKTNSQARPLMASQPDGQGNIQQTGRELQVQTSGSSSVRINLASAAVENPNSLVLQDGGIVMVERRDPKPIHVLGLVAKPDRYEFPISEDLRLLDAIALASGTRNPFADKVFIIRNNPSGGEPILIEASIKKAKRKGKADLRLAPGDIVTVEQTPNTAFYDTIRLIGFGINARAF
ncbi:MAG: polysaccharide biosynthesis/export family protein [Planctomycetaceae bacterium]|nr:polysaccharide biosynthesis/export family protein [Planctomycetaceae bacterium]